MKSHRLPIIIVLLLLSSSAFSQTQDYLADSALHDNINWEFLCYPVKAGKPAHAVGVKFRMSPGWKILSFDQPLPGINDSVMTLDVETPNLVTVSDGVNEIGRRRVYKPFLEKGPANIQYYYTDSVTFTKTIWPPSSYTGKIPIEIRCQYLYLAPGHTVAKSRVILCSFSY